MATSELHSSLYILLPSMCLELSLKDALLFWSGKTHGGVKAEPRQVFLFDHRIFVALPANSDGFFDYQLDIKVHYSIDVLLFFLLAERISARV